MTDVSTADAWKRSVLMLNQAKLEIALNPVSVTQPQPAGQKLLLLKFPAADTGVFWTQPLSLVPGYVCVLAVVAARRVLWGCTLWPSCAFPTCSG